MSRVLTNENNYYDIADTIRQMKNVNTTYKPREMAAALKDIYSNEVEGTLPLSFQANGNNLLDYRIDGASGGVGERTKNLLKNTADSRTINGVTFTVNNDKSITCNGTASSTILIVFSNYFEDLIANNEYIFSGCPSTGSISTYRLQLALYSGAIYNVYGGEKKFTYKEEYVGNPNKSIRIVIEKDCVCNNLTFYPMMRLASIEDDTYEPYGYKVPVVCGGTTTNIYLDEPIEENESISLSDTNTNIPTIDGTNILTIDTTVQPSNVYIQAPKDSDEIIEIINTLEAI